MNAQNLVRRHVHEIVTVGQLVSMESWDVVVIGSGPSALRAAIACAEGGVNPLMIDELGVGSSSGANPVAGLAASIDEMDSKSHAEDTLICGGDAADQSVASSVCKEAVNTLAELERWGLVLRRREGGLPFASKAPGHKSARLTGCGDSTIRETTRVLEEQVIKRGIRRNTDSLPLTLVTDNNQVRGVIILDIISGEVTPIQAKAVILATDGHQGLWSSPSNGAGTGSVLAMTAGVKLRGMEITPKHPLSVRDFGIDIPIDILGVGGRIRRENGEDVGPEEVLEGEKCILDLRGIDTDSMVWFSQTSSRVKDRLGIDISRDVFPISPSVAFTIGGVPSDESGRVIFEGFTNEGLPARLWFTGLYAVGRSANSGMHGEAPLPGNLLLEELVTGKAAGSHATEWVSEAKFGGEELFEAAVDESSSRISALHESKGIPIVQFFSDLTSAISSEAQKPSLEKLREIRESGISLTDESPVMNTEVVEAIRLQGMAALAESILSGG